MKDWNEYKYDETPDWKKLGRILVKKGHLPKIGIVYKIRKVFKRIRSKLSKNYFYGSDAIVKLGDKEYTLKDFEIINGKFNFDSRKLIRRYQRRKLEVENYKSKTVHSKGIFSASYLAYILRSSGVKRTKIEIIDSLNVKIYVPLKHLRTINEIIYHHSYAGVFYQVECLRWYECLINKYQVLE